MNNKTATWCSNPAVEIYVIFYHSDCYLYIKLANNSSTCKKKFQYAALMQGNKIKLKSLKFSELHLVP